MTTPEKNLNYETVSKTKGFLGEFDGSWTASWNDVGGGTVSCRRHEEGPESGAS